MITQRTTGGPLSPDLPARNWVSAAGLLLLAIACSSPALAEEQRLVALARPYMQDPGLEHLACAHLIEVSHRL